MKSRRAFVDASRKIGKPLQMASLNRDANWKKKIAIETQKSAALGLSKPPQSVSCCPICQSEEFKFYQTVYSYPYVQCEYCTHIYSQLQPIPELLKKIYGSDDADSHTVQSFVYMEDGIFEKRVKAIALPKVVHLTETVGGAKASGSISDALRARF